MQFSLKFTSTIKYFSFWPVTLRNYYDKAVSLCDDNRKRRNNEYVGTTGEGRYKYKLLYNSYRRFTAILPSVLIAWFSSRIIGSKENWWLTDDCCSIVSTVACMLWWLWIRAYSMIMYEKMRLQFISHFNY